MSKLLPHYKATLRLGIPIAIGQIGVIIMGFADTMMVGRYATDALASASFVNSVFNLISFLIMGYSYGLTPLVSAHCAAARNTKLAVCSSRRSWPTDFSRLSCSPS